MSLEMGLWKTEGDKLSRIVPTALALESQLETYIESDPTILGMPLLLIGRQVPTAHGGFIDLLAVDETGAVHILELKRDKTPRDVTAQALDYGSWVSTLSRADIVGIWNNYRPALPFEEAFADAFSGEAPPEDLNTNQVFTIVASSLDAATERIVRFLNEGYGIPINAVFFKHFEDGGQAYLARTWLVDQDAPAAKASGSGKQTKNKEPWNGSDWYVSFGDDRGSRNWDDAVKYGFVSAGGGKWYSKTLKNLPEGARVFACIPKVGYVGVGTVAGLAQRFDKMYVQASGGDPVALASVPLEGIYRHADEEDDEVAEWVVPVIWTHTVPKAEGFWRQGMFANQNTVAKLRQAYTIEQVTAEFGLDD